MSFFTGYKIETSKLLAKKKYIVFLIISVIICLCCISSQFVIAQLSDEDISIRVGNFAMLMLPFFVEIFIPLIIFMASADLVSTEIYDHTIKAMLFRPISRFKLIAAKTAACFSVSGGIFIGVLIACTVIDLFVNGAGGFRKYFLLNVGSYMVDLIPLLLIVIMAVLINLISKSASLAMFMCILVYAVLKYCGYFTGFDGLVFTSYLQWHKLWIGAAIPFGAMIGKITLLLGYAVVMFSAAYYLFDKRDY